EGRAWVTTALARFEALPQPAAGGSGAGLALRAKALAAAARFAFAMGELNASGPLSAASAKLARAANDPVVLLDSLDVLGLTSIFLGDIAGLDAIIDEANKVVRASGDPWSHAFLLNLQAERARRVYHDYDQAKA